MTTYEILGPGIKPIVDAQASPFRVACVDMGSNAIRFAAAEFTDDTLFTVLASERRLRVEFI